MPTTGPTIPTTGHDESATIQLSDAHSRVYIESRSTLQSPTPIFRKIRDGYMLRDEAGTKSFSNEVLGILSRFPLYSLNIRVGDKASSTSGSSAPKAFRGPSGTHIAASFARTRVLEEGKTEKTHEVMYASLLRHLLDNNLFPTCGPLDSIRVRKHGHATIVHPGATTVDVESSLAADAAAFCQSGVFSLLLSKGDKRHDGGWGRATSNSACHESDSWGLFESLFQASSGSLLSGLLLGNSPDVSATDGERNSMWLDMQVSDSCFGETESKEHACTVSVARGASYSVSLPPQTAAKESSLNLSLGDLILGRKTIEQSTKEGGFSTWYPCPLSTASTVTLLPPADGYQVEFRNGLNGSFLNNKGDPFRFDVLNLDGGFIDLNSPWIQISRLQEHLPKKRSNKDMFGISRSIQRRLGAASSGTMLTVVRYDHAVDVDQNPALVNTLDVLPSALMKPKLSTLRMTLYRGEGAGSANFVPSEINPREGNNSTVLALRDLKEHRLRLSSDGSLLFDREFVLFPDSSLWLAIDFDEVHLPFLKFPADPNRGIDVFPSRAVFMSGDDAADTTTLHSPSVLIIPPVPDMSMPFNVISLSCTLWAFVLGSLVNILVRRGTESIKREFTGEVEKRPIIRIKDMLLSKIGKIKLMFQKKRRQSKIKVE